MTKYFCRYCNKELKHTFVDLSTSPLANSYLKKEQLNQYEKFYPLHVFVCDRCFLVQLPELEKAENIFSDYAYFSSFSKSWLEHAKHYVDMIVERFGFNEKSFVIEIASNDGYLLQFFKEKNIPLLGIEPASNVAEAAIKKGIPTLIDFFNTDTAKKLISQNKKADLVVGNNVLAHVPNLNDFIRGIKLVLKPDGLATLEFPHLLRLIEENQFDTIYHEHFSYFSFATVNQIFDSHKLKIFDVEEIPTHGGSLRIYVCHKEDRTKKRSKNVKGLLEKEKQVGIQNLKYYQAFHEKVKRTKRDILEFLIRAKKEKKRIVGYGAPAKGNTLLNYCGIGTDFIDYTVDKNPYKQGCYLPGCRIPIYHPAKIKQTKPDYVVILPWNIKNEIMEQISYIREWKGRFVTFIPEVRVM